MFKIISRMIVELAHWSFIIMISYLIIVIPVDSDQNIRYILMGIIAILVALKIDGYLDYMPLIK